MEVLLMRIQEYLEKAGVKFEEREHKPTFSAQQMAATEHEPGKFVAKPVIVKVDGKDIMCVLAACYKIDLRALKSQLGAKSVELVEEEEVGRLFGDCELGAEPPFGNLYDLTTIMDKALEADDHIMFQAGSHDKAISMKMADYRKLVKPKIVEFSYQTGS
jgi:Ala-tRNA(Pro) deacylase